MNDSQGSIAGREWRVIREEAQLGPMQMALNEVAGKTTTASDPRIVCVYSWAPSRLSLGYGQNPEATDWDYCGREDIDVTRRQTGGGGIYYDRHGDVTYPIAMPRSELPDDPMDYYHLLYEPILGAIHAVSVNVNFVDDDAPVIWHLACYLWTFHPAHSMVAAGRKVAGNTQYRRRDVVVQHGLLTYSVDVEVHFGVFEGHDVTPEASRERIVGIDELADASHETFVAALTESLSEFVDAGEGAWTDDEFDHAREKIDEKYYADDWVCRRSESWSDWAVADNSEVPLFGCAVGLCIQVGTHVLTPSSKVSPDSETPLHDNAVNAVFRQVAFGGNCGQIFTTSPWVWCDPDVSDEKAELFHGQIADKLSGPWVIHSLHLVNLCAPKDGLRQKSLDSVQTEVDMVSKLGTEHVSIHLGVYTDAGEQQGLNNTASVLDSLDILDDVTVLIKSNAGSSMEMGDDLVHFGYVLEESDWDLDVCLDTARTFTVGYDLLTVEGIDETFVELDAEVDLEHLRCVHLNDSRHECRTSKDEHTFIGEGLVDEEGMCVFINHDATVGDSVPFVLETPTKSGKGFAWNIK